MYSLILTGFSGELRGLWACCYFTFSSLYFKETVIDVFIEHYTNINVHTGMCNSTTIFSILQYVYFDISYQL